MSDRSVKKAIILAAGMGKRMRSEDNNTKLDAKQEAAASRGIKALIPIDRPFLDYVLHELAEEGFNRICLVIGPDHHEFRTYYQQQIKPKRIQIEFAVQPKPVGTADALRAGEQFAGSDLFLMINSDNYYPPEAIKAASQMTAPGAIGFERKAMLSGSNIPADRISKYAILKTDDKGKLQRVIEKPEPKILQSLPDPLLVSMNCWVLGPDIFEACRNIGPSPRGEFELTDAVQYAVDHGVRFGVTPCYKPVLDLSCRADVAAVAPYLKSHRVQL